MYKTFNYKIRKGFTLLELLVVMAILAAVAGTATIALKDTDARAAAAAHVAMMDELNKGVHAYRVLNRNVIPTKFDSLLEAAAGTAGDPLAATDIATADFVEIASFGAGDGVTIDTVDADVVQLMVDAGLDALQYVNTTYGNAANGDYIDGVEDCDNLEDLVASRKNAVVAGNVFMSPAANGCGDTVDFVDANGDVDITSLTVVTWTSGSERLTGQQGDATPTADGEPAYICVGVGPSSTLFDTSGLGGMTTVPVYRHVGPTEYNRFVAIFQIGTYDATNGGTDGIVAGDQLEFIGVVDGALDTKEEELGEWDGTRNTI